MSILEKLDSYGCNTKEALERVLDDKELYIICLEKFMDDDGFNRLGDFIKEKDIEKAFNEGHTLKGVSGNLGLVPLYDLLVIIVEKLRNHSIEGVLENYKEMMDLYKDIKLIIKK